MQRIAIVLGTRPEIIKMSPVIRECERLELDYFILHTGQHYTYNMDKVFFEQLELPEAKYNLDVGSGTHGEQTGKMLFGIEKNLQKEKLDVVLVEGDTNTVLAGALAAAKLHIKVGHVEAGLRSYDRRMPEEINRVLTDHCSDYLFAPTEKSRQILLGEGIPDKKIFVTGNTIVDAVYQNLSISEERINPLNDLELIPKRYILVTARRQESVDVKERFEGIINGLELVADEFGLPVVYPIHPRAIKMSIENEYEKKTILVTGGAGCIGTNLCRKLAELGARKVIILDDLSSTNGMSQSSIWQLISQTSDGGAGEGIVGVFAPGGM